MLKALIHPLKPEAFFRAHWPRRPLVSRGTLARFGALARLPELKDAERLAETTRGPVTVFFRDGRHRDLSVAADGAAFYAEGETLYFRRLQESSPALARLAELLARDLGVFPEDVAVEAFASKDGGGTAMHCDAEQNFNIQLRGRKSWRIVPNAALDPMRSAMASPSVRRRKTARALSMREGSVLYLPRGYWHETRVRGDSFAVCFAVKPPVWGAVFLDALRQRLLKDPAFRGGLYGLAGGPRSLTRLKEEAARLLPAFADAAAALRLDDVLP